jgi:AcrR family transcriptional regulator
MAQQERAIKTRRAIVEAAAALFGERGYNGTSTTDILDRAELTRGALYFHFPNKLAIADAVLATQEEALVLPEREIKVQAVIALTYQYAWGLMHDPVLRGVVRLSVEQATYRNQPDDAPYRVPEKAVLELMIQAEKRGELLPGTDPRAFAHFLVGAFTGTQLLSEVSTGRVDLVDRITDLWKFVLPGLVIPGILPRLRTPDSPE